MTKSDLLNYIDERLSDPHSQGSVGLLMVRQYISDNMEDLNGIVNFLKSRPSAQPERKRGEWAKNNACQFCGYQPWFDRDIHTLSFCPNCGADMKGEED